MFGEGEPGSAALYNIDGSFMVVAGRGGFDFCLRHEKAVLLFLIGIRKVEWM